MTRRCSACLVLLVTACGSNDGASPGDGPRTGAPGIGGQTGEETVGCIAVETRSLAWSEQSPLGFSADQLLRALGAERETRLVYADGSSTRLSLGLERSAGPVAFEQRQWTDAASGAEPASGGPELATSCGDVVSLPVTLSLSTSDGAFAEQLPLRLLAESVARASAFVSIDTAELAGTFSVSAVDPAAYDQVLALLALSLDADAWTGTLSGQAIDDGGGNLDGVSSARQFEIGSF